ncbi:hypothetical protein GCM10028777_06200 [Angustibacter speluncae]
MPAPVVVTQHVPAPPARVYRAWTDPDELRVWWWPQWPDTTYAVDVRVGGAYRIRSEAVGMGVHGVFTALDEPDRIVLTWVWEDGDALSAEDTVTVDLAAHDGGTLVTVTHDVTSAADADGYRQGWTDVMNRLGGLT